MNILLAIPVASVTTLTPERSVVVIRAILRAECGYAKLSPSTLTISDRLMAADGGIDAEINVPNGHSVPTDCLFHSGLTGIQIKSGAAFKPWTLGAIRGELLNKKGKLCSEVERLVQRQGRYMLICTGYDITPKERNESRQHIATVLAEQGFAKYEDLIDVLGASQIAEYAERYPGIASQLAADPIQKTWTLDEWQRDAHMTNDFEESPEQAQLITHIRVGLHGTSVSSLHDMMRREFCYLYLSKKHWKQNTKHACTATCRKYVQAIPLSIFPRSAVSWIRKALLG